MSKELEYTPYEDVETVFSSCDMGMTAALLSLGYKLLSIEKGSSKKALFVFETTNDLMVDAQRYWAGELDVDAQTYFNSIKTIKNRIYSA